MGITRPCILRHTAGKSNHLFSILFRQCCYADRRFAHNGLTVQSAFSCNYHIGILQFLFQLRLPQDQFHARLQGTVQKSAKRKSKSSCRSGTRMIGIHRFSLKGCSSKRRIIGKPCIHLTDHGIVRPFLGTEHRAASLGAAQCIFHVTGNMKFAVSQFFHGMPRADADQLLQPLCTKGDGFPCPVQKFKAQRLQHSHTAIVGCAATDTNDKFPASLFNSIPDRLPHSVSRRIQRIPLLRQDHGDPRRVSHLHDCRNAILQNAIPSRHFLTQRPCDGQTADRASHTADQRFHCSLSAVCQRTDLRHSIRKNSLDSRRRSLSRLLRGQAAFKGIYRYNCFHSFLHFRAAFCPYRVCGRQRADTNLAIENFNFQS